jgi:predicted small metal-binding protein
VSGLRSERRTNRELREVLDELVDHVRSVTRSSKTMSKEDLAYAEQRLEWLAEEVWRAAQEHAGSP